MYAGLEYLLSLALNHHQISAGEVGREGAWPSELWKCFRAEAPLRPTVVGDLTNYNERQICPKPNGLLGCAPSPRRFAAKVAH